MRTEPKPPENRPEGNPELEDLGLVEETLQDLAQDQAEGARGGIGDARFVGISLKC